MKTSFRHLGRLVVLCLGVILSAAVASPGAQGKPQSGGKTIDLDKELRTPEPQDRGRSYYHFAIAKWHEGRDDLGRALDEMRKAQSFNEKSTWIRVEMAEILDKMGRSSEAVTEAQEAARIDPKDPEPHWVLANFYLRPEARGRRPSRESLRKAARELEAMREDAPGDRRAWYALGSVYLELGEPEKGIQAYEKFQSIEPGTDAGYQAIARYYDQAGDRDKAIDYAKKAVEARPDSTESLGLLANLYSRANRDKEAIPLYRQLLDAGGDSPAVAQRLASALVDAGEFDEAGKVLEELSKANPGDPDIRVLSARSLLGRHKNAEAVDVLKSVVGENPDHMEALFYLATAYERSGQTAQAIPILESLLERAKASEEFQANRRVFQENLAAAYLDTGSNEKAIAIYEDLVKGAEKPDPRLFFLLINAYRVDRQLEKATALGKTQYERDPSDSNVALVYARALADAGKAREGAEVLTRLLQSDPTNVDVYVNLSQIYLQGKRYSDAEKVLRKAEEKKLDAERVKFQLGAVYERQKEFDRAESVFKEVLKANPRNTAAMNYIGYMLADRGVRLEEAVKYVEDALALDPDNGAYLDSLGWAYFKLNALDKAETYLLKAVEVQKKDPTIHDHLGDLYFKAGDFEKAREYWKRSLEMGTEPDEIQKTREKLEKLESSQRRQQKHR